MSDQGQIGPILDAWRLHNWINLCLLEAIPAKGFQAVPLASRGRNVAQQFAHMHKVRTAWLRYNAAELVSRVPRFAKAASPSRAQLKAAFRASGKGGGGFSQTNARRARQDQGVQASARSVDGLSHLPRVTPSRSNCLGTQAVRDAATPKGSDCGPVAAVVLGQGVSCEFLHSLGHRSL